MKQYRKSGEQHDPPARPTHRFFADKRSMKCKCSRRSSKRQGLSSPACLATAAICWQPNPTPLRSQALFEAIRDYIDERYASALTRESVAQAFYISPNYLSHLFQKTGAIGFNEYLNHRRPEHAKTLLKGYDLKGKESGARLRLCRQQLLLPSVS